MKGIGAQDKERRRIGHKFKYDKDYDMDDDKYERAAKTPM